MAPLCSFKFYSCKPIKLHNSLKNHLPLKNFKTVINNIFHFISLSAALLSSCIMELIIYAKVWRDFQRCVVRSVFQEDIS